MSTITSPFHTYGFLITEEAASLILQNIKDDYPDLYEKYSNPKDLDCFKEYLTDELGGYHYGNAEYMTVWSIKDGEELDLDPGEDFYIVELQNFPKLFSQAYSSYEEIVQEVRHTFQHFLPPDYPLGDFLVEIMGEVWG